MYLIGILPAFLTLWIRRAIPESALWEKANERRSRAMIVRRRMVGSTKSSTTGAGFIFNASRIPAACGVLIAGALIVYFGGYGNAAMTIATIYLLGLAVGPFLPETAGKPLPD
jgi:hypothetical protein